jgi:hypothetical protein
MATTSPAIAGADDKQQFQNRRPRRASAAVKRRQFEQAERLPPPLDDPPF